MNVGPRKDRFDVGPRTQVIYFPRIRSVGNAATTGAVACSLITCVGHINLRRGQFRSASNSDRDPVAGRKAGTAFFGQFVAGWRARGPRSTCINLSSLEIFLTVTPFPRRVTDVTRRFRCYELRSATVADITSTGWINAMELISGINRPTSLHWHTFVARFFEIKNFRWTCGTVPSSRIAMIFEYVRDRHFEQLFTIHITVDLS